MVKGGGRASVLGLGTLHTEGMRNVMQRLLLLNRTVGCRRDVEPEDSILVELLVCTWVSLLPLRNSG